MNSADLAISNIPFGTKLIFTRLLPNDIKSSITINLTKEELHILLSLQDRINSDSNWSAKLYEREDSYSEIGLEANIICKDGCITLESYTVGFYEDTRAQMDFTIAEFLSLLQRISSNPSD